MIKVYCLDLGGNKMWAAAENLREATELMLNTYDPESIEEGFEVNPLGEDELDIEVEDGEGGKTSLRAIINDPDQKFPCIIGETE